MNNSKIVVYTAIKGNIDPIRDDIICFNKYNKFKSDVMNAKIYKILPHLFMDCEYSIWVDGNIFLNKQSEEFVKMLNGKEIAVIKHPTNKCIYQEAEIVINSKLDDSEIVTNQISRYKDNGYKSMQGMGMCGLIIRKHTDKIARLNEKWWSEICFGSKRDQISFPYVFSNEVEYIDWPGSYNNNLFSRDKHVVPFYIQFKNIIKVFIKNLIKKL